MKAEKQKPSIVVRIEWGREDPTVRKQDLNADNIAHLLNMTCNYDWELGTSPFTVTEIKKSEWESARMIDYDDGYEAGRKDGYTEGREDAIEDAE